MSKLPPLDLEDEVEKFEAFSETTDVKFKRCKHTNAKIIDGELRCPCGAAWVGNLEKLQRLLKG